MAVTYYSWDDAGAPQFTQGGQYKNNFIEVLDAILINGYGNKSGLGWTKVMSSKIPNSDRTVYKNKSANKDDMFLLAQSNPSESKGFMLQIADVVTSPELYSGYSQVASCYQSHDLKRWHAVGDERTFIFINYSSFTDGISSGYWSSYSPVVLYIGDFDIPDKNNPKGWGLLAPLMTKGTLDTVSISGENKGTFTLAIETSLTAKTVRSVTQVPGEVWSEADCYGFAFSFESRPGTANTSPPYREISDFEANVNLKAPWFYCLNRQYTYRIRGVFNIFPWLQQANSSGKRNWAKTVTVDGESYLPFSYRASRGNTVPMSVYIQITGSW